MLILINYIFNLQYPTHIHNQVMTRYKTNKKDNITVKLLQVRLL